MAAAAGLCWFPAGLTPHGLQALTRGPWGVVCVLCGEESVSHLPCFPSKWDGWMGH